jgi:glycosyltransferase involved in cell wall biosynthesis
VLLLAPAGSVHTLRWADALAARGHAVTVCSWHDPRRGEIADEWRLSCAPASGSWWPWRVLCAVSWLRQEVRHLKPDVVHVHSLGVHGALSLLLPTHAAPRVVTPWGSELRAADHAAARALVARVALRRAQLVLPTSREVAATVANRYQVPERRITVLSWGVPDELLDGRDVDDIARNEEARLTRLRFGIPVESTVVLSIRSTSPVYRTQEILDAFADATRRRPDLHLVLLTGHRPAQSAAARAQQHYLAKLRDRVPMLADRITVIEQVLSQSELFDLMRASEIAVSVPESDQRSSSVLEAAAAGCRLLLADLAAYRELVTDGLRAGLLADPVRITLGDALATATPLGVADRAANRELIGRAERGSGQINRLERLYQELAARRTDGGSPIRSQCR